MQYMLARSGVMHWCPVLGDHEAFPSGNHVAPTSSERQTSLKLGPSEFLSMHQFHDEVTAVSTDLPASGGYHGFLIVATAAAAAAVHGPGPTPPLLLRRRRRQASGSRPSGSVRL